MPRTEKLFDIGEQVMIKATVVSRNFDDRGGIKYKLKDDKTGKIFDWQYSAKEMIPVTVKNGDNKK